MNRDDIIRMAQETHLDTYLYVHSISTQAALEKFANLVAAAEREACVRAVNRSYAYLDGSHGVGDHDWHIAERVTAHCAAAIRARSEQ
jgi:hypothetical protein